LFFAGSSWASAGLPEGVTGAAPGGALELQQAIHLALQNDLWQQGNRHRESALQADAIRAGQLPDPKVMVKLANLPTDTFDFDQEPMTQFIVGVSQLFPRGDTLKLKQRQIRQQMAVNPLLGKNREALVVRQVTEAWLDSYLARQSIRLIEENRILFEQLVDVTRAGYQTAAGRARLQDLVGTQLELTRLDDRIHRLWQQHDAGKQRLTEWLPQDAGNRPLPDRLTGLTLLADIPRKDVQQVSARLIQHPQVRAAAQQVIVARSGIALARQSYRPAWGASASYGYRDDEPNGSGRERADFFSVGVTFDVPIATGKRQDQQVVAATRLAASHETDRQLLLRSMLAEYGSLRAQLAHLTGRQSLYENKLLMQMKVQAEAALSAYTADEGDFAEVMRAFIAELNARIHALRIAVNRQQVIARLNYLLAGSRPVREANP
jgi:outer membrane protein TolC